MIGLCKREDNKRLKGETFIKAGSHFEPQSIECPTCEKFWICKEIKDKERIR